MRSVLLSVVLVASCGGGKTVQPPPVSEAPEAPAPMRPPTPPRPAAPMSLKQSGIVPEWIDKPADPCADFFQYACGAFVKSAVVPPDRSSWGATMLVVEDAEKVQRDSLERAAREPGNKLGDYWAACTDEAAIEKAGTAPIADLLATI